jgi:hypothetical protein
MNSPWKHMQEKKLRGTYKTSALGPTSLCFFLLVIGVFTTLSCGKGSTDPTQVDPQVGGNWQFTLTSNGTSFAASPLQGGFLLQQNGSITGQVEFSILLPSSNGGLNINCNSGTATVTGTMSGQSVSLTATIGSLDQDGNPTSQTIALNGGALSTNGTAMQNGTYSVTSGYALVNGQLVACGTADDAGNWSATQVPPLKGGFQGFFHSTIGAGFTNQNFPVSGTFTQGPNIGAASATVTGTLLFQDPVTLLNDYPCLSTASVNGTISGNSVLLQIFSTTGTPVGQIGQTPGSVSPPMAVTLDSTQSGYIVHNLNGATAGNNGGGYVVTTKSCPAGDSGNLCLALGGSKACNQPITLTPSSLTFPAQLLGSSPTTQTIALSNNSSSALSGLKLLLIDQDSFLFYLSGGSDFNGVHNFTEQDNCTQGGAIALNAGASCTITVLFSPQESCPWLPQPQGGANIDGIAPAMCPLPLTASLTVSVPSGSADADSQFSVPLTGTGMSSVVPSVPEIDFGWEALGEGSSPQTLTFTNQSPSPVTILPAGAPCVYSATPEPPALPRPPVSNGQPTVSGIQLAETANLGLTSSPILSQSNTSPPLVNAPTVEFFCDTDPPRSKGGSGLPNLQVSHDQCSGQTLAPFGQQGNSCSLQVAFIPQPATWAAALNSGQGLDDFMQLNSMWCGDLNNPAEPSCEVDSGRFPVEIKTNPPSSLRMFPSAGMDFGSVLKGTGSNPLSITLFNDPADPNAGTVNFTAKLVTGGDYIETDNCPPTLAPNQSCTVTVIFTPTIVGLDSGKITFTYSTSTQIGLVQTIYLRGTGM